MSANLCGGHGSYRYGEGPCVSCDAIGDALLERGVEVPPSLETGYGYHQQEWSFRDLEEVALDIDNGSDEPSFTWILKIGGRWAAVRGWHDYTGWDCQSGLNTEWYESKEAAFRTLVDWEREAVDRLAAATPASPGPTI